MKKILVFPGAFKPPHKGHVSILEVVLKQEVFDQIWIIPSGKRDDKSIILTYEQRRNLGKIFVEHLQNKTEVPILQRADALDDENGKSTTEILNRIKATPNIEIVQLIGLDGMIRLQKYVNKDEKFLVVNRKGYDESELLIHNDNIKLITGETPNISSTQIRELRQSHDTRYKELLPREVAEYIEDNNLYI